MGHEAAETNRNLVFVSYSHKDETWLEKFLMMVKPLVRNGRLEVWADPYIQVGTQWRRNIEGAIARSTVALLLVSRDFLASDFIMNEELPALIDRGVRLVWVLVRPCLWEEIEVLRDHQCAHDPAEALSELADCERAIVRICLEIKSLLPVLVSHGIDPVTRPPSTRLLAASSGPGRLNGVPALPKGYMKREDLAALKASILKGTHSLVGITGNVGALGLHGQGGIGKSVLAAAVAQDPEVRHHFPDGVFWVSLGEEVDLVGTQIDLLRRLGVEDTGVRSVSQGMKLLCSTLAERRVLLVVDDVWSVAAAKAFGTVGTQGRVLYTTRDAQILLAVGAQTQAVEVLADNPARQLLANLAQTTVEALPAEADLVLEATGSVALGLALVGAALGSGGQTWQRVAAELAEAGNRYLDHPYANAFKSMQVGMAALSGEDAELYRSLAVYPEDTPIPVSSVARLWTHLAGQSTTDTRTRLAALAERRLAVLDNNAVAFHDLQREFLLLQADEVAVLHADLLAAYRHLLIGGCPSWSALPSTEPYIWDHLLYHLRRAGDRTGVLTVATDLGWLAMRIALTGSHAAESDVTAAQSLHPNNTALRWIAGRLAQWSHLLRRAKGLPEIVPTLMGLMQGAPEPVDSLTLASLMPIWHLLPRWGFAEEPQGLRRILDSHVGSVMALAFSPGGNLLASAGDEGIVRLWDPASGQERCQLEGHTGSVRALAFSPGGSLLASAGDEGTVRLWDPASGQEQGQPRGSEGLVRALAFSPGGNLLASAGDEGIVRLWDPASGQERCQLEGHTGSVRALAFSPDGDLLASAGDEGIVRLWNPISGQEQGRLEGHTGSVRALAFSPDGALLASAGDDRVVRLWNPISGQEQRRCRGSKGLLRALAFSPDGVMLAGAGDEGIVRLWDPSSGQERGRLEGHTDWVDALAFSPDGALLASAGDDQVVRLWDPAGAQERSRAEGHTGSIDALDFSPDGALLAGAGDGGVVRLWDPSSGQERGRLEGHTRWVDALAFSPDGTLLASVGNNRTLRLWDPVRGLEGGRFRGYKGLVRALAFSPDGVVLASAGDEGIVRLWDPSSGQERGQLNGHRGSVRALAFSPDGVVLASAGDEGIVRLWDPSSGQERGQLNGHRGSVRALAFSPDGVVLASAGDEGIVRLWDPSSGLIVSGFVAGLPLRALAWSAAGLAVAGERSVIVFEVRRRLAVQNNLVRANG